MSDDIDIRSGGVTAVDTDTLRHVASGFDSMAGQVARLSDDLIGERARLLGAGAAVDAAAWRISDVVRTAGELLHTATAVADNLRSAAAVYEIVELRAAREAALAAGDDMAAAAAGDAIRRLVSEDPTLMLKALSLEVIGRASVPVPFEWQALWSPLGALGVSTVAVTALGIGLAGHGRVPRTTRLAGGVGRVVVERTAAPIASAPSSLTGVIDRMPQSGAQVRVERYAMPDSTRRFAVYIAGTRSLASMSEPWNLASNVQLYYNATSPSYEATAKALRDAGAQPGDVVYAFGHSQGGMIAGHLALEEGYDTRLLVTFGSPVSADVGRDTLSVELRHSDDPVGALADSGHAAPVGAEGSLVVERVADPAPGLQDVALAAHGLDAYRDTAVLMEQSADPRPGAVDEVLAELGTAESVEAYEYEATVPLQFDWRLGTWRPMPASGGALNRPGVSGAG